MSTTSKSSILSSPDIQFLLTFAAGIAMFWLSGNATSFVPFQLITRNLAIITILALAVSLIIYVLGMAVWAFITLGYSRSRRAVLIPTAVVGTLALITSLIFTFTHISSFVQNKTQLALMTFALYIVYGGYYVIGWFIARKLAK